MQTQFVGFIPYVYGWLAVARARRAVARARRFVDNLGLVGLLVIYKSHNKFSQTKVVHGPHIGFVFDFRNDKTKHFVGLIHMCIVGWPSRERDGPSRARDGS